MNVNWTKCEGGVWCPFKKVNLQNVSVTGVYVIWYDGVPGRYVRVGQGEIKERILAHRQDPKITGYAQSGTLRVTWAEVQAPFLNGVERYLADQLRPLVGDAFPDVAPIPVNLPHAA